MSGHNSLFIFYPIVGIYINSSPFLPSFPPSPSTLHLPWGGSKTLILGCNVCHSKTPISFVTCVGSWVSSVRKDTEDMHALAFLVFRTPTLHHVSHGNEARWKCGRKTGMKRWAPSSTRRAYVILPFRLLESILHCLSQNLYKSLCFPVFKFLYTETKLG